MWHYYFANTYITDNIYIEKKRFSGISLGTGNSQNNCLHNRNPTEDKIICKVLSIITNIKKHRKKKDTQPGGSRFGEEPKSESKK